MAFIAQLGGDLKEGKTREFQEWLRANEKELANSYPDGARYIGTYFTIYAERGTGQVHTFVELESYGTQDLLAAAGRDEDSTFAKLVNEIFEFFDASSNNYTSALYKSVTAATLFGDD